MTKRSVQKARTRNALKQAAQRLLREHPIEQLTITQLAREAQVADGTFYVHFSSKNALLDELVHDMNVTLNEQLMSALLAAPARADEQLRALAGAYIDYWQAHHASFELFRHHVAHNLDRDLLLTGTQRALHELAVATFASAGQLEPERVGIVVTNIFALWRTTGLALVHASNTPRSWGVDFLCSATRGLLAELRPDMLDVLHQQLASAQAAGALSRPDSHLAAVMGIVPGSA